MRRLLDLRAQNLVVCSRAGGENCVGLSEVGLDEGSVFPAATLPDDSDAFTVISRGTVGEIVRTLVAVVDRSELTEPQLLFWRMR